MTFDRGATLTTATTFGNSDNSNLGPTAGNGFYKRWPDDLALLQDIGITDIRLTFDWARLQPKPGAWSGDWSERFSQMLDAADAIGLRVWATGHEGDEPKWVTNEGGYGADDVATKWWPRYLERLADTFGDRVHGWIPFATVEPDTTAAAWSATWSTLGGGALPVVASLDGAEPGRIDGFLGRTDRIGVVLAHGEVVSDSPGDERLELMRERLHTTLQSCAERAGDVPLLVSQFTPHHDDRDVAGQIVSVFVTAVDQAIADGADIGVAFLDPAIAGPYSPNGLLGTDRDREPAADAFLVEPAADGGGDG